MGECGVLTVLKSLVTYDLSRVYKISWLKKEKPLLLPFLGNERGFYLLFEKKFRVSSRISFGKTFSNSLFNHESVLLRK